MKKIIVTIVAVCITTASLKAQQSLKRLEDYTSTPEYNTIITNYSSGNTFDTIVGVGTTYLASEIIKGFQKTVQVALYAQVVTGGTHTGTATLEGSLDGFRYYPISNDTAIISTAVSAYSWKLTDWSNLYLRIKVNMTTGSSTTQISAQYLTRKEVRN